MRAYDMLVQAESCIFAVTGTPETPSKGGVSIADIGTGMNAHAAVLKALYARERTGAGDLKAALQHGRASGGSAAFAAAMPAWTAVFAERQRPLDSVVGLAGAGRSLCHRTSREAGRVGPPIGAPATPLQLQERDEAAVDHALAVEGHVGHARASSANPPSPWR